MDPSGRPLTARQQEVIDRVAQGKPNKQIAAELGISERAVKALVTRLFQKLGVANRSALIATVLRAGSLSGRSLSAVPGEDLSRYADAPFLITVLRGPGHEFVFVNRMFERISGVPAAALIGRRLEEAFPGADLSQRAVLDAVRETGIPATLADGPARWPDRDGTMRTGVFHTLVHPLRDPSGAVAGLLTVATPVERTD